MAGVLHPLGHLRHQLADVDSGNVSRDVPNGPRSARPASDPMFRALAPPASHSRITRLLPFLSAALRPSAAKVLTAPLVPSNGAYGTQAAKERATAHVMLV